MGTIHPNWTDYVTVQLPYAISYANSLQTVTGLDLREHHGGYLFVGVGRSGSTALTNGVDVIVRRLLNGGTGAPIYAGPHWSARSAVACGERAINNGGGYPAGTQSMAFDGSGGTSFAVGDTLCFWGVTAVPGSDGLVMNTDSEWPEFLRVSRGTTTPVVVDSPCGTTKLDNEVFCQGDSWVVWLPGGSAYELVFDYGDDSAGGRVLCMAHLQEYTEDESV